MYTHYFEITKKPDQVLWAQLMLDVEKLFKNLPTCEELKQLGVENDDKIILSGPMGDKKPICNTQRIAFNGDFLVGMGCESFTLLPKKMDDSCKTDRKPYDFVVGAVLILAYNRLHGIINIRSDGDTDEWSTPLKWVQQHILPNAFLPVGIRCPIESPPLHTDSGLFEQSNKLKRFLDNLKDSESTIGDFYFS